MVLGGVLGGVSPGMAWCEGVNISSNIGMIMISNAMRAAPGGSCVGPLTFSTSSVCRGPFRPSENLFFNLFLCFNFFFYFFL